MNALNATFLATGLLLAVGTAAAEALDGEGFAAEFVTPAEDTPALSETPAAAGGAANAAVGGAADAAVGGELNAAGESPSFEASFDTESVVAEPGLSESGAETVIAEPAVLEAVTEEPAIEPAYVDPEAAEKAERRREALKALRGPYAGISGGTDHVSIAGINDGTTAGLMLGYRITDMFSAEFALNSGTYDAPTLPAPNCAVDNLTTGLFAVARSSGPFYVKGRVGVLSETLESGGGCTGMALDDVGVSSGVGAGVRLGRAAVEFEYTQIEKEIYRLGWTLLLNF